jgi:hypothetical protein
VENNSDVLRDKHSNSVTNLEKARIWKNVTSKINALGVAPRSVKEIKDTTTERQGALPNCILGNHLIIK